jgi:two-component system, chemotaxis family, chemotaxis protein CheY
VLETRQTAVDGRSMLDIPAQKGNLVSKNSCPVLVIGADGSSREQYAEALRGAGFTVVTAADCEAAFETVTSLTPQLVVVSFHPGTRDDALALCQHLKSDSRTRAVPILLTSEAIDADDLRRATDMSVLGLTIGPRDGTKLVSAVRGVLAVSEGIRFGGGVSSPERRVS